MRSLTLVVLAACSSATPHNAVSHSVAPSSGTRMAELPGLQLHKPEDAARDCRLSSVLRAKWGEQVVTACGTFHAGKAGPSKRAEQCAFEEMMAGRQFLVEMTGQGDDSTFGRAYVGVVENGSLATYAAFFDDDPCGGSCGEQGHTTLMRCKSLRLIPNCASELCLDCDEGVEVEKCMFGKR